MGFVRRYTNLAGAIHILHSKKLTLLDPAMWDDGNDVHFMERYQHSTGAKSVAALCFAQSSETYHHWRVFSPGSDGVCIDFDKSKLEALFAPVPEVEARNVNYKKIVSVRSSGISARDLPFVKRLPYRDEQEWRVVHTSLTKAKPLPDFVIRIGWINGVILSPWMPKALVQSVRKTLKSIDGCSKLRVYQTTILNNERWKEVADSAK